MLLDPLSQDAWFITFERDDDGDCLAEPCPELQARDVERVDITIEVLGLNRLNALKKNRSGVWDACLARIQDYENAGKEHLQKTREALQLVAAKALAELCSETAEFSSVANACVEKLAPRALRLQVIDQSRHTRH